MDQYHGQGGSYLLDPETGERVPAVEVTPAPQERRRARGRRGRFLPDDPSTTDVNEAWQ